MIEFPYAFLLGTMSILSPCSLVLIPVIVGGIKRKISLLSFCTGLFTLFALIGVLAVLTQTILTNFLGGWLFIIAGSITLFAALQLLGLFHTDISFNMNGTASFTKGLVFGGVTLSCSSPYIAAAFALVLTQNTASGFATMLFYSIGHVLPFLLIGLVVTDRTIQDKILKIHKPIEKLGGMLLLIATAYLYIIGFGGLA